MGSCRSAASCARCAARSPRRWAPAARGFARLIVPDGERRRGGARRRARRARRPEPQAAGRPPSRIAGAPGRRVRGRATGPGRWSPTSWTCAGSQTLAAPRDRGGGWAQPADGGPARRGQDHGRPAAPGHPAAAVTQRGARDHADPQRGRHRLRDARAPTALPRAPPHDLAAGPGRRRGEAAPGRDHPRSPRRPVPRRAGRVLAGGASRRSASRWRTAAWRSSAVSARCASPPGSCSSAPAIPAPVRGRRRRAPATRSTGRATSAG